MEGVAAAVIYFVVMAFQLCFFAGASILNERSETDNEKLIKAIRQQNFGRAEESGERQQGWNYSPRECY